MVLAYPLCNSDIEIFIIFVFLFHMRLQGKCLVVQDALLCVLFLWQWTGRIPVKSMTKYNK